MFRINRLQGTVIPAKPSSFCVIVALACVLVTAAGARVIKIDNTRPRHDASGAVVDAHDGCLQYFAGRYYWYGTRYGSTDGYGKTNEYVAYSSPDLTAWKLLGPVLKDAQPAVYYRPYVIYNRRTRKYILWYNVDDHYGIATADKPEGPFVTRNAKVKLKHSSEGAGDESLFVDRDGTAYVAYTAVNLKGMGETSGAVPLLHHRICVEKLTPDYLASTQLDSGFVAGNVEAPALFRRANLYYLLLDNTCAFCTNGSGVRVYTSIHPLGPYVFHGNINVPAADRPSQQWTKPGTGRPNAIIKAQQTFVATLPAAQGVDYIWMGDLWGSRQDHIKGHDLQYWSRPLKFNSDGSIRTMTYDPEWCVNLTPKNALGLLVTCPLP